MKVIVTGATGYIGYAVAKAFRKAGHQVKGILRSENKASLLIQEGIEPCIADLRALSQYEKHLEECSVWVHCAFENSPEGITLDSYLIDAYLQKAHSLQLPKTLIYTSGIRVYGNNRQEIVDENTPVQPLEMVQWRPLHEKKVLEDTNPLLTSFVLRPGNIYGGEGGIIAQLFAQAKKGEILLVGEGNNYWPMVHLEDLAESFVLAAQSGHNRLVFNIVDNSAVTQREIVEAIAKVTKAKVKRVSLEEAYPILGKWAEGLATGGRISNARARLLLGWQPQHSDFISKIGSIK